jgi:hypothetical protein
MCKVSVEVEVKVAVEVRKKKKKRRRERFTSEKFYIVFGPCASLHLNQWYIGGHDVAFDGGS